VVCVCAHTPIHKHTLHSISITITITWPLTHTIYIRIYTGTNTTCPKSLLLIKYVCVPILQRSRFFVEFLELISLIGLSYSSNNVTSNNVTISMTICVEVKIFSQFCLLHEMLHNLGV
jgi:hypothetical protein